MQESPQSSSEPSPNHLSQELVLGSAIALLALGWLFDNPWLIIPGILIAFLASWSVVRVALKSLYPIFQPQQELGVKRIANIKSVNSPILISN